MGMNRYGGFEPALGVGGGGGGLGVETSGSR